VTVRLFAAAREAAGRARCTVEAADVAGALTEACRVLGPGFTEVLAGSRVWLNGDEPARGEATPLADGDELAVLPPVSGGSLPPG